MDISMIGSLFLILLACGLTGGDYEETKTVESVNDDVEVVNIPSTELLTKPPPLSRMKSLKKLQMIRMWI